MTVDEYDLKSKALLKLKEDFHSKYVSDLNRVENLLHTLKLEFLLKNTKYNRGDVCQVNTGKSIVQGFVKSAKFKVNHLGVPFVEYYVIDIKNRQIKGSVL